MKLLASPHRAGTSPRNRLAGQLSRSAPYAVAGVGAIGVGAFAASGHGLLLLAAVGAVGVGLACFLRPYQASLILLGVMPFGLYAGAVGPFGGSFSLFAPLPLVLIAAAGVLLRPAPATSNPGHLPILAFGLLAAVCLIAIPLSLDPVLSATRVLYLVSFGLFAWVVSRGLSAGRLGLRGVTRAIVVGGFVGAVGLIGQFLAQFVVGRPALTEWLTSVSSVFASKQGVIDQVNNYYVSDLAVVRGVFPFLAAPSAGQYMMVTLLVAVWYARQNAGALASRSTAAIRWGAAIVIGLGLLATLSRQAWAGALVGLCFMGFQKGLFRVVALSAIPALILVFVQVPGTSTTFGSHLTELSDVSHQESSGLRLELWGRAVEEFSHNPIIGIGPGVYTSGRNRAEFIYAHNMYLDTAVEIGAIGFLAFGALIVIALLRARYRPTFALPALVAFAVANLFDDTFYFPRNGLLIATVIAVACIGRANEDPEADGENATPHMISGSVDPPPRRTR